VLARKLREDENRKKKLSNVQNADKFQNYAYTNKMKVSNLDHRVTLALLRDENESWKLSEYLQCGYALEFVLTYRHHERNLSHEVVRFLLEHVSCFREKFVNPQSEIVNIFPRYDQFYDVVDKHYVANNQKIFERELNRAIVNAAKTNVRSHLQTSDDETFFEKLTSKKENSLICETFFADRDACRRLCNKNNFEKFLTFRNSLKGNFHFLDHFVIDTLMKDSEYSKLTSYLTNGETLKNVFRYDERNVCMKFWSPAHSYHHVKSSHVKILRFYAKRFRNFREKLHELFSKSTTDFRTKVDLLQDVCWEKLKKLDESLPNFDFVQERILMECVQQLLLARPHAMEYFLETLSKDEKKCSDDDLENVLSNRSFACNFFFCENHYE